MRALAAYFALAFGISWGAILVLTRETGLPDPGPTAAAVGPRVMLAMLAGPSVASVALTAVLGGRAGLRELGARLVRTRGPYAALLIAPGALVIVLASLSFFSPAFITPQPRVGLALLAGLLAGFFEELGWTGFATPRMLEHHGVLWTGVVLGLLWALWHGLADFWGGAAYGSLWTAHFLQWFVALTAFRTIMTWAYQRAHSLLFGIFMHATFTGSQTLLWPAVPPARELVWYGLFGAVLWVLAAALAVGAPGFRARPL